MGIISGGNVIEGGVGPLLSAGAPGAGTDAIWTLTIGGTPTSGSFKLKYGAQTTGAITWSATNGTLVANIDAALEALGAIGAAGVTTAVDTMTAGIGTITITFVTALGKQVVDTLSVASNDLVGSSPTVAVAETTPGVAAFGRGALKGAIAIDTTNGKEYVNTGTPAAPTWTVTGSQS